MAQFSYIGRDKSGKKRTGSVLGLSKREAVLKLKEKGIAVTEVQEMKQTLFNKEISIGSPVKSQQFVIFLRQFATLLRAGVSVVDSTSIMAAQTESKALQKVLTDVEEELRQGNPLSNAMSRHRNVFPPMVINMVSAGEAGGSLDDTLDQLATYFEKQHYTKQKIISAMMYPMIVGVVAVFVVIFLLAKVVPTFATMLQDAGGELPAITKFVLGASNFMQEYWWLLITILGLIYGSLLVIRKNKSSRYYFDYMILKIPVFGKLLQKSALARMTRTLSSLFSSSVPILQSLSIVEKVVENEVVAKVIRESRSSLETGQRLTEPMKRHWIFPPLVTQMISIGEETGSLDEMLAKVADFYEKEVETGTDRLKALIEPLMIVFLASVVGTIVISVMVPMFEVYKNVG
ncbi:type II secretion system F family protein [Fictibacillus norfolkensis]|uniref:Type II secretion system F family protein n=1 Tax=Fictibacillus norfolkensis TaxID=2762233 RepID=A0ABR8SI30_9BACL|nr:type II secretion system F family protein [Fictibacillus norfolkensis]MBD7963125.1 type II secretion system F family protein [Fictibacillus norfolkensis]